MKTTSLRKKFVFLLFIIMISFVVVRALLNHNQMVSTQTISSTSTPITAPSLSPSISVNSTSEFKTYRNTEFGFEFQYPADWSLYPNAFISPFSKFNLIGTTPEEVVPNTIIPSLLVNIVTLDFAARANISFKNINASTSVVVVAGVNGTKYEYQFENIPQISADLPFGEYRMLLSVNKQYEDVFNQILTSFKFLK